jgi:N-methylhydantoinase A/oxoprolinase/acetone carboxylase beta subunit
VFVSDAHSKTVVWFPRFGLFNSIAIDIGGTFSDLIAYEERDNSICHAKSLTTPENLVQGMLDCIRKNDLTPNRNLH